MLRRSVQRLRAPYMVLAPSLIATLAITWYVSASSHARDKDRFDAAVNAAHHAIERRLDTHIAVLRATSGLFGASDSVTAADFRDFFTPINLRVQYPGIQAMGYVAHVQRGTEAAFIRSQRRAGLDGFSITPDSTDRDRYVIAFVEPRDPRNHLALGYDMNAEPVRRAAMERARDTGMPAASGPVKLRQEIEQRRQAGFLIYVPTYRRGLPLTSIEERRAAHIGFVYGAYRGDDLLGGILGPHSEDIDFRVYDGLNPNSAALLHDSRLASGEVGPAPRAEFTATTTANAAGRIWLVTVRSRPDFRSGVAWAPLVFALGVIASVIFYMIARSRSRAAFELRRSESRFRSLVEQSLLSTRVLRPDGTTSLVNDAWTRLWGVGLEAVVGDSIFADRELAAAGALTPLRRAFAGEPVALPTLIHRPEHGERAGVESWVRAFAYPVKDDAGDVTEVVLVHEDVSDRRRAEDRLRYQLDLMDAITSNAGDALFQMDRHGCVTFLNPAAERLVGWTREEILGRPLHATVHYLRPDGRPLSTADCPLGVVLRRGKTVHSHQDVFVRKDGTMVPVVCSNAPIIRDGKVTSAVLVVVDDTVRRQAEEAMARLAAIVESSDDAIVAKRVDGTIVTWNAAAERIFGYAADEVIGKSVLTIVPPELHDEERELLARVAGGERLAQMETVRLARDGRTVDVALSIFPVRTDTGVTTTATVMRDITERRRSEEALRHTQKLESIGVLAGGIAHDFNNLLTGILGNASLALRAMQPGDVSAELLQDVIRASERAADLTNQLLAYAGKGRFFVEPLDLSQLIHGITSLIRSSISKKVDLRVEGEGAIPWVTADASQLQQLVMNLVINGAEAVGDEPGHVTVRIRGRALSANEARTEFPGFEVLAGSYVEVAVRDSGSGMEADTLARIFDPFFTTKFMGRGLGLAAALGIVRGHRGAIAVRSAPGQGTTFTVVVPATETAPPESASASPSDAPQARSGGLVLVADDEELVRRIAYAALTSVGFEVLLAGDGEEAVRVFTAHRERLRLMIVDLTMPLLSGSEVVARVRPLRPDVPILMSSGYGESEVLDQLTGAGLTFLQKPYTAEALVAAAEQALRAGAPLRE